MIFYPGKTLGILGGGQLGRMLCLEARRMGYRTVAWTGTSEAKPIEKVADEVILSGFDCSESLKKFCKEVDVATVEFENIPLETLKAVEGEVPLYPNAHAIGTSQHRSREKTFLRENDIPCAPFALVNTLEELQAAYDEIGPKAVLKTAAFGYDGKGQVKITSANQLEEAWESVEGRASVLEGFVEFECEVSVLVASNGEETVCYPVGENAHREHILDYTIVPARVGETSAEQAREIAIRIAKALDYRGLLAVEFFVKEDGKVIVNEMAPRPHNSGHYTQDGCATSQFEQQLRAVCGLTLGSVELLTPTVMLNLLGDMWHPDLNHERIFQDDATFLHLYGKSDASGRRKMGHVNLLGEDSLEKAFALKRDLLC